MEKTAAASLSPQQARCLRLVAKGYGTGEIAGELCIAESTVNGYLATAVKKLGAPNRRRAAAILMEHDHLHQTPENLTAQNLRVDSVPVASPSILPSKVSDAIDRSGFDLGNFAGTTSAPRKGETEHDDLERPFKTLALIVLIAAAFVFLLSHYPALIDGAKDIYNALPPADIKSN